MVAIDLPRRCARIEMLVLDVDGVLTDGSIVYTDQGAEIKTFHVRDGSGLKMWMSLGKKAAILSGRASPVVERRAAELGLPRVVQGVSDKLLEFTRLLGEQNLREDQAAYMGDDVPD